MNQIDNIRDKNLFIEVPVDKDETWKFIKDFPMYEISNKGRIRSYKRWYPCFLKPLQHNFGYLKIQLYEDGRKRIEYIHILVLETFIGLRPKDFVANHKDGIKTNNNLKNLEWITRSKDRKHAYDINLHQAWQTGGEKSTYAKLKDGEVWLIKRLLWFEWPQTKIAKMFKISRTVINRINVGQTWTHIKFEPTEKDRMFYKKRYNL